MSRPRAVSPPRSRPHIRSSLVGGAPLPPSSPPSDMRRLRSAHHHRAPAPPHPARERGAGWLYGRHVVTAALANPQRRWRRLAILAGQEEEAAGLIAGAQAERRGSGEPVQVVDRAAFNLLLPEGAVHQGWALAVEPLEPADLDDVLRAAPAR